MRVKGVKAWHPVVGVVALGVCFALGVGIKGAPAGDGGRAIEDRVTDSTVSLTPETTPDVSEALLSGGKNLKMDSGAGSNAASSSGPSAGAVFTPRNEFAGVGREDLMILEGTGARGSASPLADGGGTAAGDPCSCDSDCATPANDCERAICTETLAGAQQTGSGDWTCFVEDRPVDDPCDLDGLYCTDDLCDGGGVCVAAVTLGAIPATKTPCVYACSAGSSNAGFSCSKDGDCTGGTCDPRSNAAPAGTSTCNEAADQCEIDAGGGALGRCCVVDACTIDTDANCAGEWLRLVNPRDLNLCECPKYSAGIAPVTANVGPTAALTTTGVNRICSIDRNPCANPVLDCRSACDAGPDLGKQCLSNVDCDQSGGASTCFVQTCDADANVCDSGIDRLGDDYSIANGSYLRLLEVRFRGGVSGNDDAVIMEIWDGDPSVVPTCSDGSGVGTCNVDGVGAACNVVGSPPTSAGTCIGPQRIENTAVAFGFEEAGTDDYRIIYDCNGNCFPSTTDLSSVRNTALTDPIIIPPTGFVTFRAFNVTDGVSGDLQEVSQFHIVQAGTVDRGFNDADAMFVNGVVTNHLGVGNNVLAIELVGTKVPDPTAACCDPAGSPGMNCTDTDRQTCRTCISHNTSGPDFFGQPCVNTAQCGGFDTGGNCRETNWKGQRKPLSDPPAQLCVSGVCDTGACCNDLDGSCTEIPLNLCVGANETPQAFGSTCDPNCCSQPLFTAGNCCSDTAYCSDGSGTTGCVFGAPGNLCGNICDEDGSVCGAPGAACGPTNSGTCGGVCRDCVGAVDHPITVPGFAFRCSNDSSAPCDPILLGTDCPNQVGSPSCDPGSARIVTTFAGVSPEPTWRCSITGDKCFNDRFAACHSCTGNGDDCDPTDPTTCNSGADGTCDASTKGVCEPGVYCSDTGAYCGVGATAVCTATCLPEATGFDFNRGDVCVPTNSDPGWYHKVSVDGPAEVTWDLCCTNPLKTPAWIVAAVGCDVVNAVSPIPNCADVPLRVDVNHGGFGATAFDGGPNEATVVCADGNMSLTFDLPGGKCSTDKSACFVNDPEACDNGANGTCSAGSSYVYGILVLSSCSGSVQQCLTTNDCPTGDTCEDNFGPYQAHATVAKLVEAACCTNAGANGPGATCSVRSRIECEEIGGDWLGDLVQGVIADCQSSPCATGSCCLGPGNCDDASGAGITPAACSALDPLNAVFHGGVLCEDDPCPICIIDDNANCQIGVQQLAWSSDRFNFGRIADDFKPQSAAINRACWTFTWSNACEPPNGNPPDDDWEVHIYEDLNGIPNEAAVQSFKTSDATLTLDGKGNNGDPGFLVWTYSGTFSASVTPNDCYWFEVTGNGANGCVAFWMSTAQIDATSTHNDPSPEGNDYAVNDGDGIYEVSDIVNGDWEFCVDSGMTKNTTPGVDGGCGAPTLCCCLPGGGFIDGIGAESCQWDTDKLGYVVPGVCSGGSVCPAAPANDDCGVADVSVNAACPTASPSPGHNRGTCSGNASRFCTVAPDDCPSGEGPCVVWLGDVYDCSGLVVDNRAATRDGDLSTGPPSPQGLSCFSSSSGTSFQADTWYEFTAPCTGTVEARTCSGPTFFDTMLEAHDECNCGLIDGPGGTRVICADEGCGDLTDGISIGGPSLIQWDVTVDSTCYKLRVGGYASSSSTLSGDDAQASRGIAQLDVVMLCDPITGLDEPLAATTYPHGGSKNKYISFVPNPLTVGNAHGYEVTHVDSGASWYISTPRTTPVAVNGLNMTYVVGDATPPQFDWGTLTEVHVGGCIIATGETYEVRAVDAAGLNASNPLSVSTTPQPVNSRFWSDVVGVFSVGGDGSTTPPTPANRWTPPNDNMNGFDITAVLRGTNLADATRPHATWTDIDGGPSGITNRATNGADVLRAVNAFATGTGSEFYPVDHPDVGGAGCPICGGLSNPCATPPLEASINP